MLFLRSLILACFVLILSSCASTVQIPAQNQVMAKPARETQLSDIHRWSLKALIAIQTPDITNTANLNWIENHPHYTLNVFGPLGSHSFQIKGSPGNVTLTNPQGQTFHATSPEQLIAEQTGWNLPVSNLYYWVRGLPAPGLSVLTTYDRYNHLMKLQQGAWRIEYKRYTAVKGIDLPNKLFIYSRGITVKLIINEWQLNF